MPGFVTNADPGQAQVLLKRSAKTGRPRASKTNLKRIREQAAQKAQEIRWNTLLAEEFVIELLSQCNMHPEVRVLEALKEKEKRKKEAVLVGGLPNPTPGTRNSYPR